MEDKEKEFIIKQIKEITILIIDIENYLELKTNDEVMLFLLKQNLYIKDNLLMELDKINNSCCNKLSFTTFKNPRM